MLAAETRAARARKSIRIAVAVSLALHAAALFFHLLMPSQPGGDEASPHKVYAPFRATLPKRAQNAQLAPPTPTSAAREKPVTARQRQTQARLLTSPNGKRSSASAAASAPPTPSGSELAARALAMARGIGRDELDGGTDAYSTQQDGKGKSIEPLSLQWYFDSFIKKLNRSAAFVKNDPRPKGRYKALVEIIVNKDGSLREYRILRAADQDAEIAYIKSVVDRAVPFAAFPPDIRAGAEFLSLRICIHPPGDSDGGGFSRSSNGGC